ncbi:hypothetical protein A3E89_02735 [Candidatus Campbellbacteria bacterium RIFCSPHIGHO2_12_FULL_35_10]|uniref:Uncharacterized protein n=1 Tax=Candidatus Campbellbacteria bacterium RIFCSPHIGHO2_12_FULL_35_10 TaxID=1797578 RepID=A0A1F5EL57_9BACT|nr:MAG: hypothetical protein A3E89_02735 [Candidatus Campbellbacteria bacterium RIFCSPHIGHO2_12_FULL_35_10]
MDQELKNKIEELEKKVEAVYHSVEKIRKYFLLIFWVTLITFVVPLILMMFVVPMFMRNYLGSFQGLI